MPGTDGLSLARSLRGSSTPALALVTAHQQYAVQAFDVQALDYLLKPVDDDPVAEAVRRVGVYLGVVRQGGLPAVDRFGEIIVEFATRIAYLEARAETGVAVVLADRAGRVITTVPLDKVGDPP